MRLGQGDRIRWTRKDGCLGLVNSQTADVTRVQNGTVTFRLEDGRMLDLKNGDSQLRHIDRAWAPTVHAFQGRAVDTVIAAMETNHPHLTTQKTLYVEISRARHRAELVTDNRDTLREQLERTTGERIAALEAVEPTREQSPGPEKVAARRAAIVAGMNARGLGDPDKNPRLAERAAVMTRAHKRDVDHDGLRAHYQLAHGALGLFNRHRARVPRQRRGQYARFENTASRSDRWATAHATARWAVASARGAASASRAALASAVDAASGDTPAAGAPLAFEASDCSGAAAIMAVRSIAERVSAFASNPSSPACFSQGTARFKRPTAPSRANP